MERVEELSDEKRDKATSFGFWWIRDAVSMVIDPKSPITKRDFFVLFDW